MSATLFLQPLSGFEGISVEASVDRKTLSAWFPTDQCCPETTQSSTWVPLKVEVEVECQYVSLSPGCYLHYLLDFGGCVKKCKKYWSISLDIIGTLKVVAHGSFRWKCGSPPRACLTTCNNTTTTTTSTCQEPSVQYPVHSPSYSSPCNGTPTHSARHTSATTPTLSTGLSSAVVRSTPAATPTSRVGSSSARTTDDKYYAFLPATVMVIVAKVLLALNIIVIVAVLVTLIPHMRQRCVPRFRRPASLPSPPRQHRNTSVRISMNSLYKAYSAL